MLDFPNSPTTGQIFTAGGASWHWDGVKWISNAGGGGYLPLTGGTLSGPGNLTVNGTTTLTGNSIHTGAATFSVAATFQDTATINGDATHWPLYLTNTAAGDVMINYASSGGAAHSWIAGISSASGNFQIVDATSSAVRVGVTASSGQVNIQQGLCVGGTLASQAGNIGAYGPTAFISAYDRGNGGGTVGNQFAMYRDVNVGRFWMPEVGDVFQSATNGAITIPVSLTVSQGTTCNGSTPLSVNGNGNNYPLLLSNPSSQHCVVSYYIGGVRQWLGGLWTNGAYYLYDASSGYTQLIIDTSSQFQLLPSQQGQVLAGASGAWTAGAAICCSSTNAGNGYGGGFAAYGGGAAVWVAGRFRVDSGSTYLNYYLYGTTGVGSITANGSNTFFNTSCDVRLKDNVRSLASEINVGEDIIDKLNPVAFEWKPRSFMTPEETAVDADGVFKVTKQAMEIQVEALTDYGFIAQELHQVVPHLVHKPHSEEPNEHGVGGVWMADYSKIVPYLVAELQSLRRRVAELEGR